MIRKNALLAAVLLLFIFISWNFYVKALSYDPLKESRAKQIKPRKTGAETSMKYTPAWSKEIHEKNLFSPNRTFIEPKPVVTMPFVPPPKRPELILKGIVLDNFGDYVAYIEIERSKAIPMRKGDKTDEIELVDISERKVVLKWNAENINLSIEKVKTINRPRTIK